MNLQDKTIWITGASSGIGEEMTKQLANKGARLIISARKQVELERVKREIGSDKVHIQVLDVAKHDEIQGITNELTAKFGSIDILINNAGISQRSLVRDTNIDVDRRIMDVNFLGCVALSKAVLPQMIKRRSGHHVVISSVAGKIGTKLRSTYCGSKFALHGFYDALRAEEYENNIKVTIICPGYVTTNISKNALIGDGSQQGSMDRRTDKGLSVEAFAQRAIRAIEREKEEVIIGKIEKQAVWLKRLSPRLMKYIMRKRADA